VAQTKSLKSQNNLSSDNEECTEDPLMASTSKSITTSSTKLPETVSPSKSNQPRQSTIIQFVSIPIIRAIPRAG
jgi:hypothetical protein